ncbi:MAG: porin [Enterobacteriaceae bacterium]|nr:porin [Enterobacteriaceae bacterium]
MKRKILAVIVPALLVAGAANAAEVYNKDGSKLAVTGKFQASHHFSHADSKDGDKTYARLGIRGETQINSQLTGYGMYQTQSNTKAAEGGNSVFTRLAFVGLDAGDAGSFDYGRNYGISYDINAWTDVLPEFGADAVAEPDRFMSLRGSNLATYRNSSFFGLVDGLKFAVQYQGRNDKDDRNHVDSNGDGWGLSTSYDLGAGFAAGAAYTSSDRTDGQQGDGKGDRADSVIAGVKYDANNVYLAAIYTGTHNYISETSNEIGAYNKTQGFEVVAQYMFDFGLQPSVAYVYNKAKDLENVGVKSEEIKNYATVGATYYFNKNISARVNYLINNIDNDNKLGIPHDDITSVGLVYVF